MQNKFVLSILIVAFSLSGCAGNQTDPMAVAPTPDPTPILESFSTLPINSKFISQSITNTWAYNDNEPANGFITSAEPLADDANASISMTTDSSSLVTRLAVQNSHSSHTFTGIYSDPWETRVVIMSLDGDQQLHLRVVDDYQAFGSWWEGDYDITVANEDFIRHGISTGIRTPFSSIPTSLTQIFNGTFFGVLGGTGKNFSLMNGDVSLSVNFSNHNIEFTSSSLDINSNSLKYGSTNYFSGPVVSESGFFTGNVSGYFYGPNAEEAGGVISFYSISDPLYYSIVAGFGASR